MALKNENKGVRILAHFVLCIAAILAIAPFVLLLSASLTSGEANATHGFTFIPTDISFAAYKYIFKAWDTIGKAYLMTIMVTVVGTVLSIFVTMLMAFALSWDQTPFKGIITVLLIFSMLFNGGAIATYIVYSNVFHINNSIFAYIIPGLFMNAFSVILFKNYFKNTISTSLMDAAMLDGANMPSLKGPLMARGAREIARLIHAMGGNELSAYGLCHLGDYEATVFSQYSNNRRFGENFAKGESFYKLAEGCHTVKALKQLGRQYDVDLPITNAIDDILYHDTDPKTTLEQLFTRSQKKEF